MRARLLALAATVIALAIGWTANASAATIVVNVTNDAPDGSIDDTGCTLREAVKSANTNVPGADCNADTAGADTIVLEAGLTYKLTNHAAPESANVSGDLDITGGGGTTIRSTGPGPATIDADSIIFPGDDAFRDRAIDIHEGAGAVTLQRVRIINGAVSDGGPFGGGGGIRTEGPLTLIDSEVSDNHVARFGGNPQMGGGGILVVRFGALTMTGSTVAGNSVGADAGVSTARGGGITFSAFSPGGSLTATNSTISGNSASASDSNTDVFGGGILYDNGTSMALTNVTINRNSATGPSTQVHSGGLFIAFGGNNPTIRGSILAGNQAKFQLDCGQGSVNADLVSLGDNLLGPAATANCGAVAASNDLVGVNNPNLAPLSAFGGPTPTHLPNPGSPAIDHGGVCPATDQRGLFRAPAAPCDAGAVEVGATTTLPTDPPVTPPSNDISFGATTRDKRKGTATLAVSVPGPGELALAGAGLKAASAAATGAGEVTLSVKAAGKAKKKLRRKGKKTFEPAVTFTPTGGTANTESTSVKLVRK